MREFTAGFLFCGLGAGALGFMEAMGRLGPDTARFRNLGGVDLDEAACQDFEYLTGAPATRADVATMQPAELRAAWGQRRPDCVFLSAPCKAFSGLLSKAAAARPEYKAMSLLALQGLNLLAEAWPEPPPLLVFENVPRITSRGATLLQQIRQVLGVKGYVFHEATHDCGELGGLAQHRRRYLLVARLPSAVPAYVYQPPKRRVRGCGEVLGELPLPEAPEAGPLHRLPRLSWVNWVRLALIPAGGDWRDLPGMAPKEAKPARHTNQMKVADWQSPTGTVTGATRPASGAASVADPRLVHTERRNGALGVTPWAEPSATVTGESYPSNGRAAVADPRTDRAQYPIIIAADGTWHRPLTTLELAALQGLPVMVRGKPLQLAGRSVSGWRERIGNAVPRQAAMAMAESFLKALLAAALGTWFLSPSGEPIWVRGDGLTEFDLEQTEVAAHG